MPFPIGGPLEPSLYEGRSKSFEPDYLLLDFWVKKMSLALATVFY